MSLHVITKRHDPEMNSPVFYAGKDNSDEAVAVFTARGLAHDYVKFAGWEDEESIAELQPQDLVGWLLTAQASGTTVLAVDPDRDGQKHIPQPTISIPELLDDLGRIAAERINLPVPAQPTQLESMDMLHCQRCGKLIEQKSGTTPPECCGEPMAVAASDTIERPVSR